MLSLLRRRRALRCTAMLASAWWLAALSSDDCYAKETPDLETSVAQAAADSDQLKKPKWVRVVRDTRKRPISMQTASVRYQGDKGPHSGITVDLISAVHIGDRTYYKQLNSHFEQYDALLFELVAPEGTRVARGRGTTNAHPVGAMQNGMKELLQLEHQLELVDYTKENFIHADMSPDEFAKTMAGRGESFLQMFFRMMGQSVAQQSKQQAQGRASDVDMLLALFDRKNRALKLKRVMAEQFEDMESMLAGFSGPDGSTIITERNKVALKVLAEQIKGGKKKIGIFYGGGHMEDMDRRLRKEFTLAPISSEWLEAWNLRDK